MALRINKQLTGNDGSTVEPGTFVRFSTFFPAIGLLFKCDLKYYRNEEVCNAGFQEYFPIGLDQYITKELSIEDFACLTPVEVHGYLKDIIEEITGANTVDIVL